MNTHEKYIRETNQYDKYVEWLESKITPEEPKNVTEDYTALDKARDIIDSFYRMKDFDTLIDYEATDLSYQTQIIFPRVLSLDEKEQVENIINYWSKIPYVSVEGNYGIEWARIKNNSIVTVDIDFTKSASDDYMAREILEQLAEWIWQGTQIRRDNTRAVDGVIKPLAVRADSV